MAFQAGSKFATFAQCVSLVTLTIGGGTAVAVTPPRDWHRLAEEGMQRQRQRLVPPPPPQGNCTSLCRRRCMPSFANLRQSRRLTRKDSMLPNLQTLSSGQSHKISNFALLLQTRKQHEKPILESLALANFGVCKLLRNMSM